MESVGFGDVAGLADLAALADTAWKAVLEMVLLTPAHTDVPVPKLHVPHPSIVDGFVKHFQGFAEQWDNYRFPLPDGREFHVREYAEIFMAHWDNISAIRNPLGHLLKDAPFWMRGGVLPAAAVVVARTLWHDVNAKRRVKSQRKK